MPCARVNSPAPLSPDVPNQSPYTAWFSAAWIDPLSITLTLLSLSRSSSPSPSRTKRTASRVILEPNSAQATFYSVPSHDMHLSSTESYKQYLTTALTQQSIPFRSTGRPNESATPSPSNSYAPHAPPSEAKLPLDLIHFNSEIDPSDQAQQWPSFFKTFTLPK